MVQTSYYNYGAMGGTGEFGGGGGGAARRSGVYDYWCRGGTGGAGFVAAIIYAEV